MQITSSKMNIRKKEIQITLGRFINQGDIKSVCCLFVYLFVYLPCI